MVLDIYVVSNIKSVYDIDTINQTFSVEAKYKLRWEASGKIVVFAMRVTKTCGNIYVLQQKKTKKHGWH